MSNGSEGKEFLRFCGVAIAILGGLILMTGNPLGAGLLFIGFILFIAFPKS